MKFWDASAIVPLCVSQPASATARAWYATDPEVVAWWSSPVECMSSFCRLNRDGILAEADLQAAARRLALLQNNWYEVQPTPEVQRRAMRLLQVHSLRAADAAQLAAALAWAVGDADGLSLVCADQRLAAAARREGFVVMDPLA